jgi:hypothetical protein
VKKLHNAPPTGTFPFAPNGRPFFDYQPYLGGCIRILSNVAANTTLTIAHNLRAVPRQMYVISASGVFTPKWQTAGTWDTKNILIQLDTAVPIAPASITILIA